MTAFEMLSLAIKAKIPVLRVHTSDLYNLPDVLEFLAPPGVTITEVKPADLRNPRANVLYAIEEMTILRAHYDSLQEEGRVLILVNQGDECPFAFDCGEVPVPKSLMENLLKSVAAKSKIAELMPSFNGLTLKAMAEVIKLTTARDKALSARGIADIRGMLTGKTPGLSQVPTHQSLYLCPDDLAEWVAKNKRYFLEGVDERLVPRGLMLAGGPGTGKTSAAKYIASEFGVPLYRLDLSSALSKWLSESETRFARLLDRLEQEAPCVLLTDEVDRLFGEHEDEGTTSRLLAQFLWFSQEHRSRVLTVMTTNHIEKLPGEVYRAGRIDRTITVPKPSGKQVHELAFATLSQFVTVTAKHKNAAIKKLVDTTLTDGNGHKINLAHADIVHAMVELVKEQGWL